MLAENYFHPNFWIYTWTKKQTNKKKHHMDVSIRSMENEQAFTYMTAA